MAEEKGVAVAEDDFLYGCRSGIQKAVRRGDLKLGALCFDALWENKVHRGWLKWRALTLVLEECSYFLGDAAEFLSKSDRSDKEWRDFLLTLVAIPKNSDGSGLHRLTKQIVVDGYTGLKSNHPELLLAQKWYSLMGSDGDPTKAVQKAFEEAKSVKGISPYKEKALGILRKRVYMGGMLGDRQNAIANMVFVAARDFTEEDVVSVVRLARKKRKAEFSALAKPSVLPRRMVLPWYVLDFHTAVGKIARSILERKYCSKWGITADQLSRIWFLFSSGRIPPEMMTYAPVKAKPSFLESIWQIPSIKHGLPKVGKKTQVEIKNWWTSELEPKVKEIIEWVATKRREKS